MSSSIFFSAPRLLIVFFLSATAAAWAAPPIELGARTARAPRPTLEPANPVPDARDASDESSSSEGAFLQSIDNQRKVITDLVRTEVENELRIARGQMATDPTAVEQSLKLMMQRVMQTAELTAEVRAQLRGQLEIAMREASRRASTKEVIDQQVQESRAAALDRLRIADALTRNQEKLKQLMDRFDSLMDEGRYAAADEIGENEAQKIAPNSPIATSAAMTAHLVGARMANLTQRQARQKGVVDTLATVEMALVPFPDDQPVVYPDATVWEELTLRRKKYTFTDLRKVGPAEAKITKALDDETTLEFVETPLQDVVDYLKDLHGIEIQLDGKALEEAGVGSDTPVTRNLKGITLRSALRLMLGALELTYVIKDEVLLITTKEKADAELVTKAYPVADLVIPIRSMMGGMGGGMMGGGMMGGGMMGGGMGGMGGGMGGGMMGGGMGGMGGGMGGMGGGMF